MKTEDMNELVLDVNVAGNRAALLADFTAAYEAAYTAFTDLKDVGQQYEDVKDSGIKTLEQFEQQLADVETKLLDVTDRAAGKELIATKHDIIEDIELQRTINVGSGKQLQQDVSDKAVAYYAVIGTVRNTFHSLRRGIVKSASTLTVKEDSAYIQTVGVTLVHVVDAAKRVLKLADIIKGHERRIFMNDKYISIDISMNMGAQEQDVLRALEFGASDLSD